MNKKKKLFFTLLTLLLLLISGYLFFRYDTSMTISGWNEYSSQERSISFKHPKGWEIDERYNGITIVPYKKKPANDSIMDLPITIYVGKDLSESYRYKFFADLNEDNLEEHNKKSYEKVDMVKLPDKTIFRTKDMAPGACYDLYYIISIDLNNAALVETECHNFKYNFSVEKLVKTVKFY